MSGKKISRSQIIGIDGEHKVQVWLREKFNIIASKIGHDFGIDFIGQYIQGSSPQNSYNVSSEVISIAVRATTGKQGKIQLDKSDATILLENPRIILIVPHLYGELHQIYIKFIDKEYIRELKTFLSSKSKQKTLAIASCISDSTAIKTRLEELMSPSYQTEITNFKLRLGLQEISPSGTLQLLYQSDHNLAVIDTKNFGDFLRKDSNAQSLRQQIAWGKEKDQNLYLTQLSSLNVQEFNPQFLQYLHSLPVNQALVAVPRFPFKEGGDAICQVNSKYGQPTCTFKIRFCDDEIGLWHKMGLSMKLSDPRKQADGSYCHIFSVNIAPDLSIEDLYQNKDIFDFLKACRDLEATISWGEGFSVPIKQFPVLCNIGCLLYIYDFIKTLDNIGDVLPQTSKITDISSEDMTSLNMIASLYSWKSAQTSSKIFPIVFSERIAEENDIGEVLIPFCMDLQKHGIICWQVCSAQMLSSDDNIYVGIKLQIKDFGFIDVQDNAFAVSKSPFIRIHPNWPLVSLRASEHGFTTSGECLENSLQNDICMKRIETSS